MDARDGLVRAAAAALVVAGFAALLASGVLSRPLELALDNLGQLAAAVLAALTCARAARRAPTGRTGWALMAAGTGSWAAGQATWTVYELLLGREVPFPSLADVGFLLFPLFAAVGLVSWSTTTGRAVPSARDLLDGSVIAVSLVALSWVTTIEVIQRAGGSDPLALVLSYAYPAGDVVLTTLALFTVARSTGVQRAGLLVVVAGLCSLGVADSAYVYLTTSGDYATGDLVGAGWVLGFLWISVGARAAAVVAPPVTGAAPSGGDGVPGWFGLALPYVPMVAAEAVIVGAALTGDRVGNVAVLLAGALVALVLARQAIALVDNRRLVVELRTARDQMRHQALHDSLTGLPNRALFRDRVEHALAVRREPGRTVTVLFCDLDDFKTVNDQGGHAAGDSLLQVVAERLIGCLRPADTVARLGGDEFAVLLEDASDPLEVADRLLAAVSAPCTVQGEVVVTTMSIGLATSATSATSEETGPGLVRRADAAMYAAKAAGKGQVVAAGPRPLVVRAPEVAAP